MSMQQILDFARSFDGVLELAPAADSEYPEIAWGDHFFYFAPDGQLPPGQPYATVITKDYPDDGLSKLDAADRWRVNIHVGSARFRELIGEDPDSIGPHDYSEADRVLPHPVYGSLSWVAIVNPGDTTLHLTEDLLRNAHGDAQHRYERRQP
jgi:hypothetical protein